MFRNRGENLRAIYVLLFVNIAFFLLQFQDPAKFVKLFAFDWQHFAAGELWRAFTYQFMQAGHVGLITIPPVVTFFLNLILLTLMGMSVEEEWGTFHFLTFYFLSTLTTAAAAGYAYYLSERVRVVTVKPRGYKAPPEENASINAMTRNLARVSAIKKALSTGSQSDIDRLIGISEREIVSGVNICPPVDFKPESSDRYCVRCEGFPECSARHLRLNRPARVEVTAEVVTES